MTTEERLAILEQGQAKMGAKLARLTKGRVLKAGVVDVRATEVRGHKFVLVDENGKIRATLDMYRDGPRLLMFDENGKARAALGMMKGGAKLSLGDENGNRRAALGMTKDGARLRLFDEKGPRVIVTAFKDGPVLALADENGQRIWSAP